MSSEEALRAAPAEPGGEGGTPAETAPAGALEQQPPPGAGSSTALVAADGAGTSLLAAPEVRQFAAELATQLFQRWQAALQGQLRAELERRLAAELKHREQSGRDLAEELTARRQWHDPTQTPIRRHWGMYSYSSWEMGQIIKRQSAELAESRRQMEEIRARLRELGRGSGDASAAVRQPAEESAPSGPTATADGGELS
jgi:pyruvate/2-oxoglutarate dehydrogenase complex dihydrolipoamide acyltransferase (E2) component